MLSNDLYDYDRYLNKNYPRWEIHSRVSYEGREETYSYAVFYNGKCFKEGIVSFDACRRLVKKEFENRKKAKTIKKKTEKACKVAELKKEIDDIKKSINLIFLRLNELQKIQRDKTQQVSTPQWGLLSIPQVPTPQWGFGWITVKTHYK